MTTKKYLCLAILLAITSFKANAQALQRPDFNSGKAIWIIRAGVAFNGVVGSKTETDDIQWNNDDWDGSYKAMFGYDVTIGFNKSFGNHPLYWGMELGLSSRGYKTSASREKYSTSGTGMNRSVYYSGKFDDQSLMCHTVRFSPFTIGYRYTFLKNMAADIHLGAYASYDYMGQFKRDYTEHVYSYYAQYGTTESKETTSTEIKIKDADNMRKYDAGLNLGIGYWFGRFNVDFTWQRGFIAMYDDGDDKVNIGKITREKGNLFTNNFQLKLGYAF